MAITINGSGTLTGISAGGLPNGCILDADINGMSSSKLSGALPAISGASLTNISTSGTAKAWVNFNGVGTVAIRDSFNVSSITDGGTGTYTVNFTTAMGNTNYCVVGMAEPSLVSGVGATHYCVFGGANSNAFTRTTSAAQVRTSYITTLGAASNLWDCQAVHLAIFGD